MELLSTSDCSGDGGRPMNVEGRIAAAEELSTGADALNELIDEASMSTARLTTGEAVDTTGAAGGPVGFRHSEHSDGADSLNERCSVSAIGTAMELLSTSDCDGGRPMNVEGRMAEAEELSTEAAALNERCVDSSMAAVAGDTWAGASGAPVGFRSPLCAVASLRLCDVDVLESGAGDWGATGTFGLSVEIGMAQ